MPMPEIHLHVHVHDTPLEGDPILTKYAYAKPSPDINPEQLDLSGPSDPSPEAPDIIENPVPITPQTTHDQRFEVSNYSKRNEHLVSVDKELSEANAKNAAAERIEQGFKLQKDYSVEGLRFKSERAMAKAKKELAAACGNCALSCAIRGDFIKWSRVHESASEAKTAGQESRETWRRRLVKDPEAHCLPGKNKSLETRKVA